MISLFVITDLPLSPRKSPFAQSHALVRQHERTVSSLDHLIGAGEQRTCKRNSSHARSAIINGLPSRTSNSGDCKWGHFCPPSLAIRGFQTSKKELNFKKSKFIGRLTMSSSKLPVWLIAMMMLLSMGFVLYPQGSANAAKYCAQLRGATAEGHPDCSFSTLDKCRARVRHRGGGHCYRSH